MPASRQISWKTCLPATDPQFVLPQAGEVHVWYVMDVLDFAGFGTSLNTEETARRQSFVRAEDAVRYAGSRIALRQLLARYLDYDAAALQIHCDIHGKPRLGGIHADAGMTFNLAHSENLLAIAIACEAEVGIDVEIRRNLRDLQGLIRLVFTQCEGDRIMALPVDQRQGAFFSGWTQKEALLKAMGSGLLRDPRTVCLPKPGQTYVDGSRGREWSVLMINPPGSAAGAVALCGEMNSVQERPYPLWN